MIDFEIAPRVKAALKVARGQNVNLIRKLSRYYDEYEHEHDDIKEAKEINASSMTIMAKMAPPPGEKAPRGSAVNGIIIAEERAWGDPGLTLGASSLGLGNAAIGAVATPEQRERWGGKYASMAITEPGAGSDTAAITTTAKLDPDTNEWIINGEKIFITGGARSELVVIWATLDRSLGRAAIKSFVVAKGTPGMTLTKLENKLGIRASDTASIVFEDCRIPYDSILGSPEIKPKKTTATGFKGVMKTFDVTRPAVAAQAIGVAQAALDFTREKLEEEGFVFPYDRGQHSLNATQRDIIEMEANLEAARLLTWRSAAMLETGERNSLEASFGKAKAGRAATLVCQKCVALLGPLGYSREWLVEKFMRDCKITDIFEGTGQIQMLVIARNILGFTRDQLK